MTTTTLGNDLPRIDIEARAGQELTVTIPVLQGDGTAVPYSQLASARVQVRASVHSTAVLHTWTTTGADPNAELVDVAGAGKVRLTATSAETAAWQSTWPSSLIAVWDLEVTDTTGDPHRITDLSYIRLDPTITRT
jgi:hypothetical protein